jgi:hypothetical protein
MLLWFALDAILLPFNLCSVHYLSPSSAPIIISYRLQKFLTPIVTVLRSLIMARRYWYDSRLVQCFGFPVEFELQGSSSGALWSKTEFKFQTIDRMMMVFLSHSLWMPGVTIHDIKSVFLCAKPRSLKTELGLCSSVV